jgi:hypothetical protein
VTAGRRMDSLAKGLSARERTLLRLRAWKADKTDAPALRAATPEAQIPAVNSYARLVNATHLNVTWNALWLGARLEALSARLDLLVSIHTIASFVPGFSQRTNEGKTLAGVAEAIGATVAERLLAVWAELIALEEVLAWAAAELRGEEPCLPGARSLLDAICNSALDLAERLQQAGVTAALPEDQHPDSVTVERLRAILKASREGER